MVKYYAVVSSLTSYSRACNDFQQPAVQKCHVMNVLLEVSFVISLFLILLNCLHSVVLLQLLHIYVRHVLFLMLIKRSRV
eukprot:m.314295 g.314295  ORF g.314295 m.314295 type:complete len:80 (+) comp518201_c0_seq1:72-311(+)